MALEECPTSGKKPQTSPGGGLCEFVLPMGRFGGGPDTAISVFDQDEGEHLNLTEEIEVKKIQEMWAACQTDNRVPSVLKIVVDHKLNGSDRSTDAPGR
ncbi:hypothetical protein J6590_010927 [Homalodisca vitripennis]|nr:hypothetical protein J6590_010927 [Homalodisca vitripennis]